MDEFGAMIVPQLRVSGPVIHLKFGNNTYDTQLELDSAKDIMVNILKLGNTLTIRFSETYVQQGIIEVVNPEVLVIFC